MILAAAGVVTAAVAGGYAVRALRTASLPFSESLGVSLAAFAVLTITFNGLRLDSWVTISDAALLASGVLLLPPFLLGRSRPRRVPFSFVASGAMLWLVTLLSSFSGDPPRSDLLAGTRFTVTLLLTPLVIAVAASGGRRPQLFIRLWIFSAGVNGFVAVSDATGLTHAGASLTGLGWSTRQAALTVHPNHLALVCAMVLPPAALMLVDSHDWGPVARRGLLLAMIVSGVLLSGSRAALIGVATAVILLTVYHHGRSRIRMLSGVIFASALLVAITSIHPSTSSSLLGSYHRLNGTASVGDSDLIRLEHYKSAVADFGASPFVGDGFSVVRDAHSVYLQLLQASGIVGLAAFLLFCATVFRMGLRLIRDGQRPIEERSLALSLIVAMAVWMIIGLAQNQIYDRYLYLPSALLLALHLSTTRPDIDPSSELERATAPFRAPNGARHDVASETPSVVTTR